MNHDTNWQNLLSIILFIRNIQQNLNNIIPKNISLIILTFYAHFSDESDPKLCGYGMKISCNNKIITGYTKWRTWYCKNFISSIDNSTYIWKINSIGKLFDYRYIGIDTANVKFMDENFCDSSTKVTYACDLKEYDLVQIYKQIISSINK